MTGSSHGREKTMYLSKHYALNESLLIGKNYVPLTKKPIKIVRSRNRKNTHVSVTIEGDISKSKQVLEEIQTALRKMKNRKEISFQIIIQDSQG